MYLKLVRQPPNNETLHGHLYIDGKLYCDTLERTSVAVLPLVYPVQVTMSPKFKRLLPPTVQCPSQHPLTEGVGGCPNGNPHPPWFPTSTQPRLHTGIT